MAAFQSSSATSPPQPGHNEESCCFSPNSDLPPFFKLKPRTHDTAPVLAHIPNVASLADQLLDAARKVWPTRHRSKYQDVRVLLLYWSDDDLGVFPELRELEDTFRCLYKYHTECWQIPVAKPDRSLKRKITGFIESFESKDTLLIVCYGGHGRRNVMPGESPDWVSCVNSWSFCSEGVC